MNGHIGLHAQWFWKSAMAIIDILILIRSENILFTTGLSSTFMPILIAQGAFLVAQSNATDAINGTPMTIEEFELTNRFYLGQCAELLKELSRFAVAISSGWNSLYAKSFLKVLDDHVSN